MCEKQTNTLLYLACNEYSLILHDLCAVPITKNIINKNYTEPV